MRRSLLALIVFAVLLSSAPLVAAQTTASTPIPPPQFATEDAVVSVDVYRLNVRSAPNTNSLVLTVIEYGDIFPLIGRTEDNTWVQIQIGLVRGWVFGELVIIANADEVATLQERREQAIAGVADRFLIATRNTVGVTGNLNIRRGPGVSAPIVGRILFGDRALLVGRTADGLWWQVSYRGVTGWVSGAYLVFSTNIDLASIPIR